MSKKDDTNDKLFCSFCGKNQKEVKKLIAGPAVYICDECIQLCSEIIEEEDSKTYESPKRVMTPKEIKAALDEYVIEQDLQKRLSQLLYAITTSALSRPCLQMMWKYRRAISF